MRLVVESVSLSLLECNVGLMQHAHIRDYSSNTYMMLPLLNNSRSATYGICGDPPGSSFDAFYQSNHFSTKLSFGLGAGHTTPTASGAKAPTMTWCSR